MQEENKFKFPTEVIDLPSKGLLYPSNHPLSSGKIELKYMTAKEEDILTNQNYLKNGTVIDKLLQSLIVTKFDFEDLLVGDKNAILIAARVLGYGKDYSFNYKDKEITVDLSLLNNTELDPSIIKEKGVNAFDFKLPHSGNTITFAATGTYEFAFQTNSGGVTVTMFDLNRPLRLYTNPLLLASSEDLAASAAASLATTASYFSTAAAETATLAAGAEGQIKVFNAVNVASGNMVITVTNAGWQSSGTGTITFPTRGSSVILQYVNSKWYCIGNNGATFA
jgi:hypothetical protein